MRQLFGVLSNGAGNGKATMSSMVANGVKLYKCILFVSLFSLVDRLSSVSHSHWCWSLVNNDRIADRLVTPGY